LYNSAISEKAVHANSFETGKAGAAADAAAIYIPAEDNAFN